VLSIIIHLALIFGITFTTFYELPFLKNTPIINVKLANSNIDEIGSASVMPDVSEIDINDNTLSNISLMKKSSVQSNKVKKLQANSIVNNAEAQYLNLWQRQIESAGDKIISENGLSLNNEMVQIIATIDSLGNLIRSEIAISSGVDEIDLLAIRILNESAPFPAFDPLMLEEYGYLEIVRDWNFSSN
jgi:predicted phage tail protein